ncbi:MAG TPA: response regulator [Nitrososphaeraceae archaeon]|jgi:DNA-binding response OmpR family regulator|nr:response regulator [Nitrososphaeraceae archaeon]
MVERKERIKVMIIEDEEDLLTLYNDFLSSRGYQVICEYPALNSIMLDIEAYAPDIYLIDYRLPGDKNGFDIAAEILQTYPLVPILFITAYEPIARQISKNPAFRNRSVDVLVKPVKLDEIQRKIIDMTSKNKELSSLAL